MRQDESRPLRLNRHYDTWAQQVRDVWADQFDSNCGFELFVVSPEPPIPVTHGIVAIVIVVQHPVRGKAAVLTTAIHDDIHGPQTQESARSLDFFVDFNEVLTVSGALQRCVTVEQAGFGPCTIRAGRHRFFRQRPLRVHDGLGLVVRIPMMITPDEWESLVVNRIQRAHEDLAGQYHFPDDPPVGPVDHTDQTSLMAQRPRSRTPSSSSSTTVSSSSASSSCDEPSDEEKRTVVFAFDGRAESILLPWRDGNELHQRISDRFEIAIDMIESVVYVHHRPEDLERLGLQCLLLQRASERRPSPFMRLGLLDTDIYVEQEVMPSAFRREVVWLPHVTTRTSLLRIWGLEQLCRQHAALCRIWHHQQIIPSDLTQSFRIEDGDYLRIFIGEEDQITCPFPGEDAAVLIQLPKLTMRSSTECHRTSHIATTDTARTRDRRPGPYPRRHDGDENDEEELSRFRQLWLRPHLRGQGLQNEPVMLFDTWFLSGIRLPRCAYSRTVALPAAVHLWRDRLQQVWRDRVRPQDDLQIIHVHPDPSGSSPGGHLLLLQHVHPTEAGVILSQFNNPYRRNPNNRFAQMVPRALAFDQLLWLMDLETTCPRRDYECTGYHGTTHIPPAEVWQAISGQHLEAYVRQVAEWVSDDLDLLQISVEPVKKTGVPSQHGLELPGDALECSQFQLNAAAARFTPMQWNIFAASEFVQDLHAEWQSAAFAWEHEEPSCLIDVWFVDHHWPWPHGFSSKQVRLYEDYNTWEDSIMQVWREFLVPGAPYELSIVYPHPPNTLSACHVIVVQHPRDGHVTSLVSILNDDQDGLLLHQSAITTHEHILLDDLLVVAGRHAHCIGPALAICARRGFINCHSSQGDQSWAVLDMELLFERGPFLPTEPSR